MGECRGCSGAPLLPCWVGFRCCQASSALFLDLARSHELALQRGGSGTQKFMYQKWPISIFPFPISFFPKTKSGGEGGGRGFQTVVSRSNTSLPAGLASNPSS